MRTRRLIIIGIISVTAVTGLFFVNDSRYTKNPNECWFQDDDGEIKPCVIEIGIFGLFLSPWPDQNCDEICQQSNDENKNKWTAEYKEISPEQQCANSYQLMQDKITHIRQSDFTAVSDYVQEIDNLLAIKKDIHSQDCESAPIEWIHLVTNSEKIPNPPQIVIERAYDSIRQVTNDQIVRPEYVIPWKILDYLQQHKIEFTNAQPSNMPQTSEGWTDPTRLCSQLLFTNGTLFFASATFHPDPLEVTGIFVDLQRPDDCQKHYPLPKGFR